VSDIVERYRLHRESGRTAREVGIVYQGSNVGLDTVNRFLQRERLKMGELDVRQRFKMIETSTGRRFTLFSGDLIIVNQTIFEGVAQPIRNGTRGEILRIDETGRCRLRLEGKERREVTVQLQAQKDMQDMTAAYATNTIKTQGAEVVVDLVVPGNPGVSSLNVGYSAWSRVVDHVEVFLDRGNWTDNPVRMLGKVWSAEHEKHSASEVMSWETEEIEIDDPIEEDLGDLTESVEAQRLINELRSEIERQERERGDDDFGFGIGLQM